MSYHVAFGIVVKKAKMPKDLTFFMKRCVCKKNIANCIMASCKPSVITQIPLDIVNAVFMLTASLACEITTGFRGMYAA